MSTRASSKKTIPHKIREIAAIQRPWLKKVFKTIWILFFCFLIGFPLYIYTVSIDLFGLYGAMPSLKSIENPENDLSSELISADGKSLGKYFRFNRVQVSYDDLSPELINTLIISEDHRYHDHSGMDFWAFMRVAKGLLTLNPEGGGSTITQQLAKNLYTQNADMGLDGSIVKNVFTGKYPKRIFDKTKEWIISVQLEKNFTKEEIVAMYLNTATFGSNAYGIQVASETYFNKSPDSLNVQESAVLVGMLQAVTKFNPVSNPENSLKKRNEVLGKLYTHGYLKTRQEFDSIRSLPIVLQYRVQNQNEGLATYFRSVIGPELIAWARERGIDLYESGLKVYTTIDSRMQRYAEDAVTEHMAKLQQHFSEHWKGKNPWIDEDWKEIKGFLNSRIKQTDAYKSLVERYGKNSDSVNIMLNLKKPMRVFTWKGERDTLFSSMDSLNYYKRFLNTGFMSMDAHTGEIKAWVGGINHKYFKYDHVRQGKRQPGSTFKAFVYGTAMEAGFVPCYELADISPSFQVPGGTWTPKNADGSYGTGEMMNLRKAMALSVNSITAQVMKTVHPQNVVKFAERAGISSKLDAVPALCLGVSDVSLFELVGAYSTFVNEGIYTEPFYITRIEDKNGNVLESRVPKTRQAMKEQDAFKMIYMLMGGVEISGGTSSGLPIELKKDNEIGGKTGTTNNASDGWYMGVTKDLVSGGWVGGDEKSIHYRSWDLGQGSKTARPIWAAYMKKVYADAALPYKKGSFNRPASLDFRMTCDDYTISSSDTATVQQPVQQWKVEN